MVNRTLALTVSVVFAWLLVGTIVYKVANNCSEVAYCSRNELVTTDDCGWSIQESFYYSVQAGLSIGFGLLPESNDLSRFYTIIHILCGSSIVGGALAFFVTLALTKSNKKNKLTCEEIDNFRAKLTNEGWSSFTVQELRPIMINCPKYCRQCLEMVETDDDVVEKTMENYRMMTRRQRRRPVNEVLRRVIPEAEEFQNGAASLEQLERLIKQESGAKARVTEFYLSNRECVWTFTAFFIWILLGTLFGLLAEEWSFIQSVYFAVSSLSTGGLQSVTRTSDGVHVLFTGIYALIGVPLYALTLGMFANVLVDRYTETEFADDLSRDLDRRDLAFVEHLCNEDKKSSINLAEYTEVQLLMLGQTDRDTLAAIRDQFVKLDTDGSGRLDRPEFMRRHRRAMERYQAQKEDRKSTKAQFGDANI